MKNVKLFIASVCFTVLASACVKNLAEGPVIQSQDNSCNLTTITCEFPSMTDQNGTKVSLTEAGETGWQEGDKIVIYGKRRNASPDHPELDKVIHTLTAVEVTDPTKAVFTVDLSGLEADPAGIHPYNAMYPADETDEYLPFYSEWGSSGRTRFKDTNKMLMAGYLDGGVMSLQNLCAAITFKVSGDFDTYYFSGYAGTETVGYGQYLVELNNTENPGGVYNKKPGEEWGTKNPLTTISGPVNGNGTALNYIFIPIEANLTSGFSIVFAKSGEKVKMISTQTPLSLDRAEMVNLGLLPSDKIKDYELIPASEKATATDLSAGIAPYKSANCYVVSAAGTTNDNKVFKFPTVKGNTFIKDNTAGTSVGSVVSAEVLWETWNTSTTPTAKSIIKDVEYKDGFVYFKTPASLHDGNALIAAKDSGGNILWSWHIWVPDTDYTYDKYGIAEVNMMSRNLGALIDAGDGDVRAHGLLYQWGRKDPFVGQGAHGSSDFAKVAGVGKTNTDSAFTSEDDLAANPTVYAAVKDGWYSGDFTAFWGTSKTVYDPCPPGWKVPYKDDDQTKLFTSDITVIVGWDYQPVADKYYAQIGSTKFPISGYIYYNGNFDGRENKFRVWSSKARVNSSSVVVGSWLQIDNSAGTATVARTDERAAYGCSVRCVAE